MAREQERSELHRIIWKMADDLVHGGAVAAWDFKQYVLGFLFYRFISENLTSFLNTKQRQVEPDFDYATKTDEEAELGRDFCRL